jgi:hypothetical protein
MIWLCPLVKKSPAPNHLPPLWFHLLLCDPARIEMARRKVAIDEEARKIIKTGAGRHICAAPDAGATCDKGKA